ncbi:MAG: hypothetical protein JSV75_06450 [Candidatus Bathyarchaeota archaeon]|nr:MAG: hypothetical protein JSV75_06450 [Candidatus Bathyarchaeota archaeon]
MKSVERKTIYFETPGKQNTKILLDLVKNYAQTEGIKAVVVASTTGDTGVRATRVFKGLNVIVVSHHVGFKEPGIRELTDENHRRILDNGAKILTATHALSGVERAIRKKFGTVMPLELLAHTLRLFGEGTKVCVEITIMAADAGLIPVDEEVIAIGGTGRGADTAMVLKPATASRFFNLKIREILAKPRNS